MSNPPNLPPLTATADRRGVAPPAQHATSKISVIGSTLRIEGDQIQIIASDKLLLEGRVRGDLFGTEIVIGESAHVEGVVVAKRIEVHGRVAGALHARDLIVGRTAQIDAEMHYGQLTLNEGARFEGRSRRLQDSAALPEPRGHYGRRE